MRLLAVTLAAFGLVALPARAAYPERPITLVAPFSAGGATDTIARITAEGMSKALGQTVVVENVTGAGGTLASARVARSDPDGYTLLIHHIGISTAPALYRKLPFDTKTAYAPIGLVSDAPMTIIARPDFPADTLAELVAAMKADGTKITFGNAGLGAASHLCGTLFLSTIGARVTTVPYKGNGPVMTDLIGRQIDMSCDQTTNTTGPIQDKQVKAYAVTSKARVSQLPQLPTAEEAGLKGFEMSTWHGIYAPKGTPPDIVQTLVDALQTALAEPALAERFAKIVTTAASKEDATPARLEAKLISEIDRWGPVIRDAGQFAD